MRAGVDDACAREVVWAKLSGLRIDPERKLQNAHPRIAKLLAYLFHRRRDDAEVLGDDGQSAESFGHCVEQCGAGAFHPSSVDGSGFATGHFPVGLEAAEVIDANDVVELER